jgi:predicted membrane chloride channel (bestrophin family)
MALMVSFLIVTRSNIAYARFMEARDFLNDAMKACRELTQHMITFTRYELKTPAMQWRQEIARRTVVLLRTVVSVLEVSVATWNSCLAFILKLK